MMNLMLVTVKNERQQGGGKRNSVVQRKGSVPSARLLAVQSKILAWTWLAAA